MNGSSERIIGTDSCPRCGSEMKIRTERREGGHDTVVIKSSCPGCKDVTILGFTTESAMKIRNTRAKLMAQLEEDPAPEVRRRIIDALQRLEQYESMKELGL